MSRAKKGSVSIHNRKGFLRLRLPRNWFNGKLKFLSLHLPDTPENREIANAKANLMENDFIYERFDFSLEKYKLSTAPQIQISFVQLFEEFQKFKCKTLKRASHHNFVTTLNKLKAMPESVLMSPAKMQVWLLENNSQEQARRNMMRITQCYDWAMSKELMPEPNPFLKLKKIKKFLIPSVTHLT